MTSQLLSRPPNPRGPRGPRRPPSGPPPRPLTATGVLAALQSAGLGVLAVMVVVLVGWATAADSRASATTAMTGALQVWLATHGTDLTITGGSFSLTPLGLTALPLALLATSTARAGRSAGITGKRAVIALTSAVTATYAVLATAIALLAGTEAVTPRPVTAFLGAALLAATASAAGALRATGRAIVLWHRLPGWARLTLPAGSAAAATLLAGGGLLAGLALTVHHDRGQALTHSLDAGAGGTALVLLGCLAYVPNAVLWAAAFAAGPGFTVGTGTSVTMAGTQLGAVPAVPLLAALPDGPGPGVGWLAAVLPLAAGVTAATVLRRAAGRPGPPPCPALNGWRADLRAAGLVGLAAGLLLGLACGLAAGAAGPGRMVTLGPTWWATGLAVAVEVAAVAAGWLLLARWRAE